MFKNFKKKKKWGKILPLGDPPKKKRGFKLYANNVFWEMFPQTRHISMVKKEKKLKSLI